VPRDAERKLSGAGPAAPATGGRTHRLTILASDGLDCVSHDELERIVREHDDNPQALADALAAARDADEITN